ncbi:hypothetical protein D556_3865 [Bordetella holmesii 41130]|uniref:N-acetyltransferase YedL n=1 Tax=Bordetella holmesii 1058 TaxID=1247648 RepID=A0ABN0RYZ0_9BORD|nr:hypothetical protein D560_3892 [Bordetella holmesii ATCC 51541]EWM41742.1 hypothetical protein D556_3865 [Bordetella holmesii 41130]EWM45184.1 hypothetical protein D557_3173 [Bordetella holmesii 70147]EXX94496.1 hypothetical protein D559_1905 [Bordetella holmesii 1058]
MILQIKVHLANLAQQASGVEQHCLASRRRRHASGAADQQRCPYALFQQREPSTCG